MIDKVIRYIWMNFDDSKNYCELPLEYQLCVMSAVVFNPEYKVIVQSNKPLVYGNLINDSIVKNEIIPEEYLKEAERLGILKDKTDMYSIAHTSDFLRYNLLYNSGGIYSDTDIIFIRPLDDLLDNEMVLSKQSEKKSLCCGVMMSEPYHNLFKDVLEAYRNDYRHDKWTYNSQVLLRRWSNRYRNVNILEYEDGFFYPSFKEIGNGELYSECNEIKSQEDIDKYFKCRSHHIWSQVSAGRKLRKYIRDVCFNRKVEEPTYMYQLSKYIIDNYNELIERKIKYESER